MQNLEGKGLVARVGLTLEVAVEMLEVVGEVAFLVVISDRLDIVLLHQLFSNV